MIQYEGSIWRPPSEAHSLILQATVGCSHNACIFCISYKVKQYRVRGVEGIRADLDTLNADYKSKVTRVFLADGNALAMSTEELVEVLEVLGEELSSLQRVSLYGYAKDVRNKSIDDLRLLKEKGLGIVYFGLETGDDELLNWIRKGVDSKESVAACKKIRTAGIPLSITIILGLGGLKNSKRHAEATAQALNEIDPEYIGALTLMTPMGTRIGEMVMSGEFQPMEPIDTLKELRILIEELELTNCVFRTNHASNYLPIRGTLNADRSILLATLTAVIESGDMTGLRPTYLRGL